MQSPHSEAIETWRDFGHRGAIARCLECLAFIAAAQAQKQSSVESAIYVKRAIRLFGAAEALREISESPMTPDERVEYDREVKAVRAQLDASTGPAQAEAACKAGWAEERAMSMAQAIEYAPSHRLTRASSPIIWRVFQDALSAALCLPRVHWLDRSQ